MDANNNMPGMAGPDAQKLPEQLLSWILQMFGEEQEPYMGAFTPEQYGRYTEQIQAAKRAKGAAHVDELGGYRREAELMGFGPELTDPVFKKIHDLFFAPSAPLRDLYLSLPEHVVHGLAGARGSALLANRSTLDSMTGLRDRFGDLILNNDEYVSTFSSALANMDESLRHRDVADFNAIMRRDGTFGPRGMREHLAEIDESDTSSRRGAANFMDIFGRMQQSKEVDGLLLTGRQRWERAAMTRQAKAESMGETFVIDKAMRGVDDFEAIMKKYRKDLEKGARAEKELEDAAKKALAEGDRTKYNELQDKKTKVIEENAAVSRKLNEEVRVLVAANPELAEIMEEAGVTGVFDAARQEGIMSSITERHRALRGALMMHGIKGIEDVSPIVLENMIQQFAGGDSAVMKNETTRKLMTERMTRYYEIMKEDVRGFDNETAVQLAQSIQQSVSGTALERHSSVLAPLMANVLSELTYDGGRPGAGDMLRYGAHWTGGTEAVVNSVESTMLRRAGSGTANMIGALIASGQVTAEQLAAGDYSHPLVAAIMRGDSVTQEQAISMMVDHSLTVPGGTPLDRDLASNMIQDTQRNLSLANATDAGARAVQQITHAQFLESDPIGGSTPEEQMRNARLKSNPRARNLHKFMKDEATKEDRDAILMITAGLQEASQEKLDAGLAKLSDDAKVKLAQRKIVFGDTVAANLGFTQNLRDFADLLGVADKDINVSLNTTLGLSDSGLADKHTGKKTWSRDTVPLPEEVLAREQTSVAARAKRPTSLGGVEPELRVKLEQEERERLRTQVAQVFNMRPDLQGALKYRKEVEKFSPANATEVAVSTHNYLLAAGLSQAGPGASSAAYAAMMERVKSGSVSTEELIDVGWRAAKSWALDAHYNPELVGGAKTLAERREQEDEQLSQHFSPEHYKIVKEYVDEKREREDEILDKRRASLDVDIRLDQVKPDKTVFKPTTSGILDSIRKEAQRQGYSEWDESVREAFDQSLAQLAASEAGTKGTLTHESAIEGVMSAVSQAHSQLNVKATDIVSAPGTIMGSPHATADIDAIVDRARTHQGYTDAQAARLRKKLESMPKSTDPAKQGAPDQTTAQTMPAIPTTPFGIAGMALRGVMSVVTGGNFIDAATAPQTALADGRSSRHVDANVQSVALTAANVQMDGSVVLNAPNVQYIPGTVS